MRRVFSLALGLGAGLLIGAYVIRRLDEAQQAVAPTTLAGQAGRAAATLTERFKEAAAAGREAAAAREAELRARFEVPSVREALGG
jgi:hypothetical protein